MELLVELRGSLFRPGESVEDVASFECESVQVGIKSQLMDKNKVVDLQSRMHRLENSLLRLDVVEVGKVVLHFLFGHLDEFSRIRNLTLGRLNLRLEGMHRDVESFPGE